MNTTIGYYSSLTNHLQKIQGLFYEVWKEPLYQINQYVYQIPITDESIYKNKDYHKPNEYLFGGADAVYSSKGSGYNMKAMGLKRTGDGLTRAGNGYYSSRGQGKIKIIENLKKEAHNVHEKLEHDIKKGAKKVKKYLKKHQKKIVPVRHEMSKIVKKTYELKDPAKKLRNRLLNDKTELKKTKIKNLLRRLR